MANIIVVDDSEQILDLVKNILKKDGHKVQGLETAEGLLEKIAKEKPDLVILDIMLPKIDGIETLRQIRNKAGISDTRVVILSAKTFEFDRRNALKNGADAFIPKPIQNIHSFLNQVNSIMTQGLKVCFHGVRGTLPIPGKDSLIYGGNTSCVSVRIAGKQTFIFDCGSGIKNCGDSLMGIRLEANIFISHAHWDHINAFPFFTPLYVPGNKIHVYGPKSPGSSVQKMVSDQMSDIYFPITVHEFGGYLSYTDLSEENFQVDGVEFSTMLLSHPGNCLGYKMKHGSKTLCYITDNKLFFEGTPHHSRDYEEKLCEFISEADLLITDATYRDSEYPSKVGWGHSCTSQVAKIAHRARIKKLCLFHHDPGQKDADIEKKWQEACATLDSMQSSVECLSPKEGDTILIETAAGKPG